MFDDIHHFDTSSWQLLAAVAADLRQSCLLLITMRAGDGVLDARKYRAEEKMHIHKAAVAVLDGLRQLPTVQLIQLPPLTRQDVSEMMQVLLPNCDVHDSNVEVVLQQTRGHPVHVEEISLYIASLGEVAHCNLSEAGGLMSNDLCTLAAGSISNVVLSRTDTLRPHQQLTLKVCSVLGSNIAPELLLQTYPLAYENEADMLEQLVEDLRALCQENFLWQHDEGTKHWYWNTQVAQDVVYGMIPFNQRRLLHARLATALEKSCKLAVVPMSHIAYHWSKSCAGVELVECRRTRKAIQFWKLAAEDMKSRGALLDAIRFMTKSLELTEILLSSAKYEDPIQLQNDSPSAMLDMSLQYNFIARSYLLLIYRHKVRTLLHFPSANHSLERADYIRFLTIAGFERSVRNCEQVPQDLFVGPNICKGALAKNPQASV